MIFVKDCVFHLTRPCAKTFKYKMIKLWKYKEDSKARQRRKIMISLKVRLGRLIRICQRGIEKSKLELSEEDGAILSRAKNIHMQILPGQYMYMESFNSKREIGYKFTLENFNDGKLTSKLKSDYIQFDSLNQKWTIHKYEIREFYKDGEQLSSGNKIDTTLNLHPTDFTKRTSLVETMNLFELNKYIKEEEMKGSEQLVYHKIEKHKRIAFPFASIIFP